MRWKVSGHSQATGRPWEVTILARSQHDAVVQARNLAGGSVDLIAPSELHTALSERPFALNNGFRLLVPPLMLVALVVKAGGLAASHVRRMIVSE
jgi:hypothetical protein